MSDHLELDGRRALVTGGTQGIGHAVATRLREAGATVLTTARARHDDSSPEDRFLAADLSTADGCATVADDNSHPTGDPRNRLRKRSDFRSRRR